MKMKKLWVMLLLLYAIKGNAQTRPFTITACDTTSKGYYFLSTTKSGGSSATNQNLILDDKGQVVYYQPFTRSKAGFDFKIQRNGLMSYWTNGKFYLMDKRFHIVDSIVCAGGYATDLHELQILPNGHYLLLGEEVVTMDLSNYPMFMGEEVYGAANAKVTSGLIQELDSNKNLVFEWHAKDHFAFDDVDEYWLADTAKVDWTHFNALELDTDGNILISSRHFNEITKISHKDGSIIWRMGGKRNQFSFIDEGKNFYGQHDIRRLPNGHITLFDDGHYVSSHGARGVEYAIDEKNKTAQKVWEYTYDPDMFSFATGNTQRLDNGNTLVNFGLINKNKVCFAVVNPDGNKVFEADFDSSYFSYRAFNYPTLPWALSRPSISCKDSAGTKYLDAGPGYSNYLWSNGSNDRKIPVTMTGTYFVYVPYGEGFISSERTIVADTANPCGVTASIAGYNIHDRINIFPNPVEDRLNISSADQSLSETNIKVCDISGREISITGKDISLNRDKLFTFNTAGLTAGIYVVRINGQSIKFIKK